MASLYKKFCSPHEAVQALEYMYLRMETWEDHLEVLNLLLDFIAFREDTMWDCSPKNHEKLNRRLEDVKVQLLKMRKETYNKPYSSRKDKK